MTLQTGNEIVVSYLREDAEGGWCCPQKVCTKGSGKVMCLQLFFSFINYRTDWQQRL